jgi:hypothetical protein
MLTYIITSITACSVGLAVILVIMSVSTWKTAAILYISFQLFIINVKMKIPSLQKIYSILIRKVTGKRIYWGKTKTRYP